MNLKSLPPGQHLIEASAGTGKTYTLIQLILRLLLGQGTENGHAFRLSEILVVTFTQAATHELKQRVAELLREAQQGFERCESKDDAIQACIEASSDVKRDLSRIRQASLSLDEAPIYTIHGFCSQILKDHSIELGLPLNVQIETDQSVDLLKLSEDLFRQYVTTLAPLEQEIALSVWASPTALHKSLQPLAGRQTLTVVPEPYIHHVPEDLESSMRELKRRWLEDDIESLIDSSDLMRNRKPFSRRGAMSQFCATSELAPFSEFWQLWRASTLAHVTKKNGIPPQHPIFASFDEINDQLELLRAYRSGHVWTLWCKFKSDRQQLVLHSGRLGVDELIPRVSEALATSQRLTGLLAKQYPVMLIDEFQDTDDQQYHLFRTIHQHPASLNLVLIGDPKQAIYRFRGADIKTYLRAANDSLPAHQLDTNWRSSAPLVEAVNHLFGAPFRFSEKGTITFFASKASPKARQDDVRVDGTAAAPCWFVVNRASQPNQHATQVTQALQLAQTLKGAIAGPSEVRIRNPAHPEHFQRLRPEQLSILVRNRREAQLIQSALASCGLESVYLAQTSVFETQTARDLSLILAAMLRPKSPRALISAVSTRLFQRPYQWLVDFKGSEQARIQAFEAFTRWGETWERSGVGAAIHQMLRDERLAGTWLEKEVGARELTDLRHLAECLDARQRQLSSKSQLIDWLIGGYQLDETLGQEDTRQRLHTDDQLINIMTIHAAKGLEFEVVCVPFADFGSSKTPSRITKLIETANSSAARAEVSLEPSESIDAALREMAKEEEMRLFYVAATRAKSLLILGVSQSRLSDPSNQAVAPIAALLGINPSRGIEEAIRALPSSLFAQRTTDPDALNTSPSRVSSEPAAARPVPSIEFLPKVLSYTGLTRQLGHSAVFDSPGLSDEPSEAEQTFLDQPTTTLEHFLDNGLPKGASLGIKIHDLLQHLDFAEPLSAQSSILDPFKLGCGIEGAEQTLLFETWLESVLTTPILEQGVALKDITTSRRLNEVEFDFPIQSLNALDALGDLSFLDHTRFAHLNQGRMAQYMTGSIDLVFEHQDRFYIVDYKSNHLGPTKAHYANERLEQTMREHRYDLQYAIYSIALEKYLRLRSPGRSFNDQFGGVIYLFLRGMSGGSGSGVFFTRPDGDAIASISLRLSDAA